MDFLDPGGRKQGEILREPQADNIFRKRLQFLQTYAIIRVVGSHKAFMMQFD